MSAAVAVFYAVCAMDMVRPIRWKTFPALKRNPPHELNPFQRHTPKSRWLMAPRASFGPDPMTPSNILAAIPGVRVVEMKRNQRWAWCCGGGGGVPEANPNLARWSATDRLRESKETGPELVLTSSALCQGSFNALEQSALRI
jgi:hypothetical protein